MNNVDLFGGYSISEAKELARMIEEWAKCNPKATNAQANEAVQQMSGIFVDALRMRYNARNLPPPEFNRGEFDQLP